MVAFYMQFIDLSAHEGESRTINFLVNSEDGSFVDGSQEKSFTYSMGETIGDLSVQ